MKLFSFLAFKLYLSLLSILRKLWHTVAQFQFVSSQPPPGKSGLLRYYRYWLKRFSRLKDSPRRIARGLAAGVFTGCFPLLGLQTILGILVAWLIRGNKIAAAAGTWISNPLTYLPIFTFNFGIGRIVTRGEDLALSDVHWENWSELLDLGTTFVATLMIGSFLVGLVTAVCAYFLSLWLLVKLRKSGD